VEGDGEGGQRRETRRAKVNEEERRTNLVSQVLPNIAGKEERPKGFSGQR